MDQQTEPRNQLQQWLEITTVIIQNQISQLDRIDQLEKETSFLKSEIERLQRKSATRTTKSKKAKEPVKLSTVRKQINIYGGYDEIV